MRQIKFRAWDKDANRMWTDPSINNDSLSDKSLVWMQFTGLLDRHGKEIYEGDILDSEVYPFHDEGESNYLAEVCWDAESAGFFGYMYLREEARERKSGIAEGNPVDTEVFPECEVIGNIYENPALIGMSK